MTTVRLVLGVAATLALVGCSTGSNGNAEPSSQRESPTGLSTTTSASASQTQPTGIAVVDAAIDGELRDSVNTLQPLLRYTSLPCTSVMAVRAPPSPACRPGERDGTPVEALPVGDCLNGDPAMRRVSFQRPDEFREEGVTSPGIRLYAVYVAPAASFLPGQYVVVLLRPPTPNGLPPQTATSLSMSDDGITGIDYGCEDTPEQLVAAEHLVTPITSIEPSDATPVATTCDEAFGITRVNQLFAALNHGDVQATAALLPTADTGWDFEIQPDILLRARSDSGTAVASDIDVTSHAELDRIMAQFADFHLVFTAPLAGGVAVETNPGMADRQVIAIGPVLWRGTSPSLTALGKTAVFGGGKTAIDCETGLFSRVLLGPLEYQP